jgi:rubrerythrin
MAMRTISLFPVFLSLLMPVAACAQTLPQTITVMQTVLKGELLAHAQDLAYAEKAREEKYPRIAALALALAASEGVHARNFLKVLLDLGIQADVEVPPVKVGDTKTNLRAASTAELEAIDTLYPRLIRLITPERCDEAIRSLTNAWQAEKQHRDLITELISGSGLLFGVLARTIEGTPVDYFICNGCGSTVPRPELPPQNCPICAGPAANYVHVDTGT